MNRRIRTCLFDAHAAPRLRTQSRLRGRSGVHAAAARRGTSLLEVLVGLGIMAVGAIGAFVLFPLSAINVSRALIDDRTTTCAVTADGQMRDIHRNGGDGNYLAVIDAAQPVGTTIDDPSAPAVVDPMGVAAGRGNIGNGGTGGNPAGTTAVQRVPLRITQKFDNFGNLVVNPTLALRFCSQMDGLSFSEGGKVDPNDPNFNTSSMRELRYNWMWVLQRPVWSDKSTARMQVVVYDKRAHLYAPPSSEAVFAAAFVPGVSEITGVPSTAEVRKGTWVMDATSGTDVNGRVVRHAEFYRVTGVTDTGTSFTLEVHKPIARADGRIDRAVPLNERYNGLLVVMPAVAEVFERPVLTAGVP
jgi:hypothetical protein